MQSIEDALYSYLAAQSTIIAIVDDRIYPTVLPQDPTKPAVVFYNVGTSPLWLQNAKPVLDVTRIQIDCYADTSRDAKLLAKAVRDVLESYVGLMGTLSVQAVLVLDYGMDDFDDVPNDFRVISEYEIWHKV